MFVCTHFGIFIFVRVNQLYHTCVCVRACMCVYILEWRVLVHMHVFKFGIH